MISFFLFPLPSVLAFSISLCISVCFSTTRYCCFIDSLSLFHCTVCPGSSYPNLYNELLYKMGNYFLDIWYQPNHYLYLKPFVINISIHVKLKLMLMGTIPCWTLVQSCFGVIPVGCNTLGLQYRLVQSHVVAIL